ncbi:MAG: hypothetical protein NVSMB21_16580 [Vulcanimicrobiaceae bacterium]
MARLPVSHPSLWAFACALVVVATAPARAAAPASTPSAATVAAPNATPNPDPEAERLFARARDVWRARTDVPYVRYGALVRYLHDGHVFDNWWDAKYRSSDGALSVFRLVDAVEEKHRLGGIPFSIFGLKIADTNPDAEPIRLDEPRIDPATSFGVLNRFGATFVPRATPSPRPNPANDFVAPDFTVTPSDRATPLREITHVEATTREYEIRSAGSELVAGARALHLTLQPLRDPKINRLRDVWLDPTTYRTVQMRVQGILNGKPYDGIGWTVHYALVEGRQYVQQIVADEPLHFGLDVTVPKFEIDFVDYRFPANVPKYTFDRPF